MLRDLLLAGFWGCRNRLDGMVLVFITGSKNSSCSFPPCYEKFVLYKFFPNDNLFFSRTPCDISTELYLFQDYTWIIKEFLKEENMKFSWKKHYFEEKVYCS